MAAEEDGMDLDNIDNMLIDLFPLPDTLNDPMPVLLPPQPQPQPAQMSPWSDYLHTLFAHLQLAEPVSKAMREQITAAEALHHLPGPNFAPNPRDWAERLVATLTHAHQNLPLVAGPPALYLPPIDQQAGLHEQVERLLAALRAIQSPAALLMLEKQVGALSALGAQIVESLGRLSQLAQSAQFGAQAELENFHSLFNAFRQLALEAIAALRFAANVLVLRVDDWRAQQRRLANRAETREKRHQQGQYVKALPEQRRVLDDLALQVVRFGDLMEQFVYHVQVMHNTLPEYLGNPLPFQQTLEPLKKALRSSLPLLAEHTLVIVNQPLQVLKKGNKLAFTVLWLAGPVVRQHVVGAPHPQLRARLVPEEGLTCMPDLRPLPANAKAARLTRPCSKLLGSHNDNANAANAANASARVQNVHANPGHYAAHEAKFSGLRYDKKEEDDDGEGSGTGNGAPNGAHAPRGAPKQRVAERLHFVVVESSPIAELANVRLQAVSHPMVLTVSVNQEEHAMCTILWRNAFGRQDQVAWGALRHEISDVFEAQTTVCRHVGNETHFTPGRGISLDQLENIRQRYFDAAANANPGPGGQGAAAAAAAVAPNDALQVKYKDFMYKNLREVPRRDRPKEVNEFTLWAYLYGALRLVLEAPNLWSSGVIYGFVSKEQARDLLVSLVPRPGSSGMLVRFAEKQPGAVCVVRYTGARQGAEVDVLEPWNSEALKKQALYERLRNKAQKLEHLVLFLRPNADAQGATAELKPALDTLVQLNPNQNKQTNGGEQVYDDGYSKDTTESSSSGQLLNRKSTHALIREGERGGDY